MFIVYSPEGQSAIGATPIVPQLRVDPSKKILAVGKSSLDELHSDVDHAAKESKGANGLRAYQYVINAEAERRKIVRARELMSQPVITVSAEASIQQAWDLMAQSKVHHLPVVDLDGRLEGLVTLHDILLRSIVDKNGLLEETRAVRVADLMQNQVITTNPETDIRRLAEVMGEYHLGCMPIMSEQHQLVGMITLSDVIRRLALDPPLELYV